MEHVTKKIASTLKLLRKERGWSLDVTSQMTGVSKAMLGQIERSESSPTIAMLWKIATGFEVSFSTFIDNTDAYPEQPLYRADYLKELHPNDDKMRILSLFPYDAILRFEVFVIELLPGCEHLSSPHQKGVIEHVMVSQGALEVLVNGVWLMVKEREGLRFDASKPHGYRNVTNVRALFHDIIYYQ